MNMTTERLAKWQETPLGPWERHRRDLDGGRVLIVARGLDGRWMWDLWANRNHGQCLDLSDGFDTLAEAKSDADRAAAEAAAMTDEQMAYRNAIEFYREPITLNLVTVGDGKLCALCGNEIGRGTAAERAEGEPWLWCGSCASRNPDSAIANVAPDAF